METKPNRELTIYHCRNLNWKPQVTSVQMHVFYEYTLDFFNFWEGFSPVKSQCDLCLNTFPLPLQSHLQKSAMTVMHALLVALAVVPMTSVISAFNGDDVLINQLPDAEITTTASHTISHSVISM